jgi:hypothetical protein
METAEVKPSLWPLVVGFSLLQSGFSPWSDQVEILVDKMAMRQVFSKFFDFLLLILISPTATYSLIIQSPTPLFNGYGGLFPWG